LQTLFVEMPWHPRLGLVPHAGQRFVEFFTVNILNPNTRKAYYRAAGEFFDWCNQAGLNLLNIEPIHVAAWIEDIGARFKPPTVKQMSIAMIPARPYRGEPIERRALNLSRL
jgi:hypothetical protein